MAIKPPVTMPTDDRSFQAWLREAYDLRLKFGEGSPEGVVFANRGTLYVRTDGLGEAYRKSTDGVSTGWVAL